MNKKVKEALREVARESFKYVVDEFKHYYPWLKSKKDQAGEKILELQKEAEPKINKASDEVSKFVNDKYKEAVKLAKKADKIKQKAEKQKKKQKMASMRKAIIATTIGFGAGAATGYALVKKSQIKESDYIYSDDEVIENTNFDKGSQTSGSGSIKFKDFNENYKISEDGTTLIRK